jgi:aspartyl-tRNA(Asn)/glutamyl-tRNA(Gln) amidotransferase subunit B
MSAYETVIGLEVHVQLSVASKLFSHAPCDFGGEPNSRVAPLDMGLPGTLPVLNRAAVSLAVRAALALEGEVQPTTKFDRKNYFYPDLPKGYQISQYDQPLCRGGRVPLGDGRFVRLHRIHVEEDAGKSMHVGAVSLVDCNRAGVALVEIVSEPDLRSPADAHAFLEHLKRILQYAHVSECDMEKGSLRCDANVSLRPRGAHAYGTKVEIKNLNSFKMVQRALEYEERRQTAVLLAGGNVRRETRLWNDERGETAPMRGKEAAEDYRYFPDPDLPPVVLSAAMVQAVRDAMPELPAARAERYGRDYGLGAAEAEVLLADHRVGDYFEAVARGAGDGREACNWVIGEVLRGVRETAGEIARFPVPAAEVAELIGAVRRGLVNRLAAKKVFQHLVETGGGRALDAIRALGLEQESDRDALAEVVRRVLRENEAVVADYRGGKSKALHALKGFVMRATKGKANPALLDELLAEELRAQGGGPARQ